MRRLIESRRLARWLPALGLSLLPAAWQSAAAQDKGHEVDDDRIVVESLSHWQNWQLPTHAVDLLPDGGVRPHAFRERHNILDDLATFRRTLDSDGVTREIKGERVAIMNVHRTFQVREGEIRVDKPKIGKYLDADYLRYPASRTHVVLDGQAHVVTDTTMIAAKEVRLHLENLETGATSTQDYQTKDKVEVPMYDYFLTAGVSRVGSNPGDAANILDGDPSTYWEPDLADPIESWWVELDLGRTVPVDELVLSFVDEDRGDPFRQFKVLAAPGQQVILQDAVELDFFPVAGTKRPNVEQRLFRFPMQDEADVAPGWTGRMIETIRIVVFDTKGSRHTLMSQEEWEVLEPENQGDIVYFVRDHQGLEEPVTREEYEGLPAERQGRRDYYRRELPRLADIEIWGSGDNISPGIIAGGGGIAVEGEAYSPPSLAFDGDYTTQFLHTIRTPNLPDRGALLVDVGATFWLDRMRISAQYILHQAEFFDGYIHLGSDGTRDARGNLKWVRLSPTEREDNMVSQYYQVLDEYNPSPKVRYLDMRIVTTANLWTRERGGAGILEYQLFSSGYPAEVVMHSDMVSLPNARNYGRISWEPYPPEPGTRQEVRTRTGDLLRRIVTYHDKSGKEINQTVWEGLHSSLQGPADTTFVPAAGWSAWSNVYPAPGARVTSPGLRKYMQLEVKLITEDRDAAATIRSMGVELLNPAGERILGELWPAQVPLPGRLDTFDVFIRPRFIERPAPSSGFDEILLEMSAAGSMELLELDLGFDPETDQAERTFRLVDGVFVDEGDAELEMLENRADSVWVRLPDPVNILPDGTRIYNRITAEGDEVPVDQEGLSLTAAAYNLLDDREEGHRQFYRQTVIDAAAGEVELAEVDEFAYYDLTDVWYYHRSVDPTSGQVQVTPVDSLEYLALGDEERVMIAEQGPIRYFRILQGDGAQYPLDIDGEPLTESAYNALPAAQQGAVIGPGQLVRLRFQAPVFRNGTTLQIGVRDARGGADNTAAWQTIDPGDANPEIEGNTLSIGLPLNVEVLEDVAISPNPFTPNGDGVNDAAEIGFTVFKISEGRQVRVRIYSLAGQCLWEASRIVGSGKGVINWDGRDGQEQLVPPGLYLCQLELDVDSEEQAGTTRSRLISVVY